MVNKFS